MKVRRLVAALLAASLPTVGTAGTITLSDATFNEADWSARNDGSTTSGTSGTQVPIGGNPGPYRVISMAGSVPGFGPPLFQAAWHFNETQSYDPSSGAITSIDYSEDVLRSQDPGQTGHLALRQDDIIFRSKEGYAIDGDVGVWETQTLSGLVASDFEAFFNGNFIPNANPDFTSAGTPIVFGVHRNTFFTTRGAFDSQAGVDNWSVTLNVIPEPASAILLSLSLLAISGLSRFRRR